MPLRLSVLCQFLLPAVALAAGSTPLSRPQVFEANHGQANSRFRFISRGSSYDLLLAPGEATVRVSHGAVTKKAGPATVRIRFQNADRDATMEGLELLSSHSNYFIGNDSRFWKTDIPHYGRVRY